MRFEPRGLSDWGSNRRENRAEFVGDAHHFNSRCESGVNLVRTEGSSWGTRFGGSV
jgi:hypothetical protein